MTDTNDGVISETSFDEEFRPIEGPNGEAIWDYCDVLEQPTNCVWSIVDSPSENLYALAGFHLVNTIGFVVTENPWVTGTEEAEWCIFDHPENSYIDGEGYL